jgi:hypothetical protein
MTGWVLIFCVLIVLAIFLNELLLKVVVMGMLHAIGVTGDPVSVKC